MALTRNKKKEIVEELSKIIKEAKTVVFVNFHGLSVQESSEMRRKLREDKVGYRVAKKTLIRRALEGEKIEGKMPELEGEVALSYSNDLVAPASGVYAFQKKLKDKIQIIGGIFDGAYKDVEEMTEIAQIPPMPTLRGMFVNVINSPIQGLAVALGAIAEKK